MDRVCTLPENLDDATRRYEEFGERGRDVIVSWLPTEWTFRGRRVLDFGCGAGRTLRQFTESADQATCFVGCDIHFDSVRWVAQNLSPPFGVFRNGERPPLPFPDQTFDLIYAVSVFSHLSETWASWLLELRRVLRPDGLLIATVPGPARWAGRLVGSPAPPIEELGRHVDHHGDNFYEGHGPHVYLSEWWIREHWGRAFEIVAVVDDQLLAPLVRAPHEGGQGVVVMRSNGRSCTPSELESPNTQNPRDIAALVADRPVLLAEIAHLRWDRRRLLAETEVAVADVAAARADLWALRRSRSWRWTALPRWIRSKIRFSTRP
jgi:SAM-dependent methyltransferase